MTQSDVQRCPLVGLTRGLRLLVSKILEIYFLWAEKFVRDPIYVSIVNSPLPRPIHIEDVNTVFGKFNPWRRHELVRSGLVTGDGPVTSRMDRPPVE